MTDFRAYRSLRGLERVAANKLKRKRFIAAFPFSPCNLNRLFGHGAIAQLGERRNGIAEVGGSIPPGSTITLSHDCYSGYRTRFGMLLAPFDPLGLYTQ